MKKLWGKISSTECRQQFRKCCMFQWTFKHSINERNMSFCHRQRKHKITSFPFCSPIGVFATSQFWQKYHGKWKRWKVDKFVSFTERHFLKSIKLSIAAVFRDEISSTASMSLRFSFVKSFWHISLSVSLDPILLNRHQLSSFEPNKPNPSEVIHQSSNSFVANKSWLFSAFKNHLPDLHFYCHNECHPQLSHPQALT